ncbi:hypothetical protein E2562_003153 [Oryza meyeriana var. granulata]|uniref:Uncharacterized protein n=1 Tax=Oryza meyeriana var. granulata TaxID=110450 RepID=A0A6G1EUK3_9ORYZ|nr:hypothetical protein E2562_003153 [Oryza meyeriana var. granulata]
MSSTWSPPPWPRSKKIGAIGELALLGRARGRGISRRRQADEELGVERSSGNSIWTWPELALHGIWRGRVEIWESLLPNVDEAEVRRFDSLSSMRPLHCLLPKLRRCRPPF